MIENQTNDCKYIDKYIDGKWVWYVRADQHNKNIREAFEAGRQYSYPLLKTLEYKTFEDYRKWQEKKGVAVVDQQA